MEERGEESASVFACIPNRWLELLLRFEALTFFCVFAIASKELLEI